MNGYKIPEKKKRNVQQMLETKVRQKHQRKLQEFESWEIENFSLIAGYTTNNVSFGTTHEQTIKSDKSKRYIKEDDEFPFL